MSSKKNIVVFVSGRGSLFEHLADHQEIDNFQISLVVSSRSEVPAVAKAISRSIPIENFEGQESHLFEILKKSQPDLIVLAGFLRKVPDSIIQEFSGRIINTHPSLLPKFGGKGMYGLRVHKAVLEAGESETGCSTHFVTQNYDEGKIIKQKVVPVFPEDTPENLQERVKQAEKENLLETIRSLLQ